MKYLTCILLCMPFSSVMSADYFWVGNGGNWSDLSHWASTSGGSGGVYAVLPGSGDHVFFDANSFTTSGQTVTIDVDAVCANLDFTGTSNSPGFSSAVTEDINIHGNLTMIGAMTWNHSGDVNFLGTAAHTINSAGNTFGQDILYNGAGGSWTLLDAISVTGEIGIETGTLDLAGFAVNAGSINSNLSTNVRSLDFDNSSITISGGGTSLDLRGNTSNFTIIDGGANITFTNAADITVEAGDEIKTIPNMSFPNVANLVRIRTGSSENNTKRITFGDISIGQDGCDFRVDGNNDDSNIKTYGTITLPSNCDYILGSGDGTGGYAGTNHTVIGSLVVANGGDGTIRGRFLEFSGPVDFDTNTDCNFTHETRFQSTFNVASTKGNHLIMNNDAEFNGLVTFEGDSEIRLDVDIDFNAGIVVGANSDVVFDHNGASVTVDIVGGISIGVEATVDFGEGDAATLVIDDISAASKAQFDINNGTGSTTVGNINLIQHNVVRFNTSAATTITGTLTSPGDCSTWLWLKSLSDGVQADVSFSSAQTVTSNLYQDINCTTSNLTNTNGVDLSNNVGINFPSSVVGLTFYWVGNTSGNTKTGSFSTGNNDNWSNPDNWSTSSGTYTGNNQCIPGAHDNVIFDVNSFSSGAGTVDLDLMVQACNDITWTGIPAGCTMDGGLSGSHRDIIVYGNAVLHANLDNQYEGAVVFSAHDGISRSIASNSSNYFGNVIFDFMGGNWELMDNIDLNGGQGADLTVRNGTLDANTHTLTLEDDWTIQSGGVFVAGTSTVEFDGPASQNSRQEIKPNGSAFYNLHINRGTNGGGSNDLVSCRAPITINNDLHIRKGGLEDNGNQITGNATGILHVENGARLMIGKDNISTVFPANYVHSNIDMHESGQTRYNSDVAQVISSEPDYGRLYLVNNKGTLVDKTLDGPITINDLLHIDDYQHFVDGGFQVTGDAGARIRMDANSQMTIGTATSSTQFPANFTLFDFNQPSTVVYNSGLAQTIKGISGTGDAQYDFLTICNSAGTGSPNKTLDGSIIMRSDFVINANNTVDVDATSNFSIELQGNWTNNGTFSEQQGRVSFTGNATQTLTSGGTVEGFYDLVINNTHADGLIINDDIEISNSATFTDGVVYEGGTSEVVEFLDGASVSGASDASHVDGRVEKTGTDAFEFPVGDLGVYQAISITAPANAGTTFRAEYLNFDSAPTYDDTQLDPTIHHISDCEHWILDQITAFGDAVFVTLNYKSHTGSCSGVTDPSSIVVARWDGTLWQNEGGPGVGGASGSVTSATAISTFSPFTIASTIGFPGNPLPVELLFWNVQLVDGSSHIDWSTASETNNSHFLIERSSDAERFKPFEFVEGAGNSNAVTNYQVLDDMLFSGWNYYRLTQYDFDGTATTYGVKAVFYDKNSEVLIYPNPATDHCVIDIGNQAAGILLHDVTGKLVYQTNQNSGMHNLNLSQFEKGMYTISLKFEDRMESYRLIVK